MRFYLVTTMALFTASCAFAQQTDYANLTLSFENITSSSVVQNVAEMSANEKLVEFGDYDNDGDFDVVMAVGDGAFGSRRNKLYRNDSGVLVEVSGTEVIPGFAFTDTSRCTFFRDYDHDGFLDIIVVNDSNSGTATNNAPGKTKYFRNVDGNTFVNESERLSNQTGAACSGSAADFDQNGFCDLLMCNYPGPSQESLGLNNINDAGPGFFTVVTDSYAPQESDYGVNSAVADMNGDGKLDMLIGNLGDPDFIYYNDNNNAGEGVGDFRYPNSGQLISSNSGSGYQSLHPSDFNNDGMIDFYYSNVAGNSGDLLYINTGNDGNNMATFVTQPMPSNQNGATAKISNPDLDGDGRDDLIIMSQNQRPHIYRNTSENGDVSFIEWTPAVFTSSLTGWHADAVDLTGNERIDVFVGANSNDHVFQNIDSVITDVDDLKDDQLPSFHNTAPIAIAGRVSGGESIVLTAAGVPNNANVSVLLRSGDDMRLNISGSNVAVSDRPGEDVDEAIQFSKNGSGDFVATISNESAVRYLGDANGDGAVDLLDVNSFVVLLASSGYEQAVDMNQDGEFDLLDVSGFVGAISSGTQQPLEVPFIIEFLSRTD